MENNSKENILEVKGLKTQFFTESGVVRAVDGIDIHVKRGEVLGIVGESGCGKSTLARLVTMIEEPTSGSLKINDQEIAGAEARTLRALRSRVQIVFQNPYGSLNPRQKTGLALEEPLQMNSSLTKAERKEKACEMMEQVGLRPEHYDRYPHMFSGGQRQRIAIARALMLNPEILVLDEPVSALDVSIQAQVLNLLTELQEKHDLAYLFISHDLSVVKHIADDVMVMYLGNPVEHSTREELFKEPRHPYTRALLSATPVPIPGGKKERMHLSGEIPSPLSPPDGCAFHPRCPLCFERCRVENPEPRPFSVSRVSCHACKA